MSWLITPQLKSVDGIPIGTPYGGGFIAGFISHTANGVPTHALIVAPRVTGASGTGYTLTTNYQWKTSTTTTAGTTSAFDGAANTAAMVTAGIVDHPAAGFCTSLSIGGFTDWYLPSRYELNVAYFNLKPGTASNNASAGTNSYAVPQRNSNWTADYPPKTALTAFNTSTESFTEDWHWSSSEMASNSALSIRFSDGGENSTSKTATSRCVRAFRRIAL